MNSLERIERSVQTLRLSLLQSSLDLTAARALAADAFPYCQSALGRCREALDEAKQACEIALDEIPMEGQDNV